LSTEMHMFKYLLVESWKHVTLKIAEAQCFCQFRVCSFKATYQMFHHSFRMNQLLVCALKSRKVLR